MAGASVISWFVRNILGQAESDFGSEAFEQLEAAASKLSVGSDGVMFLPYIHGERVPYYEPSATGAFFGLRCRHRQEHLLRSVYEGVALNISNCFDLIGECNTSGSTAISELRLAGGGSGLRLWRQIIADCIGLPIQVMDTREAGTLGGAMLASIGAGLYNSEQEAVDAMVRIKYTIEPKTDNHHVYQKLNKEFNSLYQRTK